jgi:hypothetical protein
MGILAEFYLSTTIILIYQQQNKLNTNQLFWICNSTSSNFMCEAFSILTL